MSTHRITCLPLLLAAIVCTPTAQAQTIEWIEQLGTSNHDTSRGVSADGLGNVYISGNTKGSLGGANAGDFDAFVSKYDASGTLLWTGQLGTSSSDTSRGVSADGLGSVYISGSTDGSLGGAHAGGIIDVFVSKYDASGVLLWTEQFGTGDVDFSAGLSADGLGNVYITGTTGGNGFVGKYDASGTLLWTEQVGFGIFDTSEGVSADGLGNVYISGFSSDFGEADTFLRKYDTNGTLLWTEYLDSFGGDDKSNSVSADGLGNVYISGQTDGSLAGTNAGGIDAFVSKYDASGTLLWTEQLGSSGEDISWSVSADGLGNVYISGQTKGSLAGTNAGGTDAFVSKYDASGTLLWTEQLGSSSTDRSNGVSADGLGNVYISGYTWGNLEGISNGGLDAFVAKLGPIPPIEGDYNGNGVVDAADYTVWRDSWLQIGSDLPADGDGDGFVGNSDYPYWASRYGNSAANAESGTVPEPSSIAMVLATLAVLATRVRKSERAV